MNMMMSMMSCRPNHRSKFFCLSDFMHHESSSVVEHMPLRRRWRTRSPQRRPMATITTPWPPTTTKVSRANFCVSSTVHDVSVDTVDVDIRRSCVGPPSTLTTRRVDGDVSMLDHDKTQSVTVYRNSGRGTVSPSEWAEFPQSIVTQHYSELAAACRSSSTRRCRCDAARLATRRPKKRRASSVAGARRGQRRARHLRVVVAMAGS